MLDTKGVDRPRDVLLGHLAKTAKTVADRARLALTGAPPAAGGSVFALADDLVRLMAAVNVLVDEGYVPIPENFEGILDAEIARLAHGVDGLRGAARHGSQAPTPELMEPALGPWPVVGLL